MLQAPRYLGRISRESQFFLAGRKKFPVVVRCFAAGQKKAKKKQAPQKDKKDGDDSGKKEEAMLKFIDATDEVKKLKHDFTEEEKAEHMRIGKEYNRQRMIQHNQMNKDLSTKMWLQDEAMNAMPLDLLEHALIIDNTPPPRDRPWPVFMTPPVPGLNLKDLEEDEPDISKGDIKTNRYSGMQSNTGSTEY